MLQIINSYDELVLLVNKERLSVFFSDGFFQSLSGGRFKVSYHYLVSDTFVIPIAIFSFAFFRFGQFTSSFVCIKEDNWTIDSARVFMDECLIVSKKKLGVQWIAPGLAANPFPVYPSSSLRIGFGTYLCDLDVSDDVIFSRIHSKHRNVIKRAIADGVSIKFGGHELIEDYLLLDKETWSKSGRKSYGLLFFNNIVKSLPNNSFFALAYKDGVPQSGACVYYDKNMGYYMYGANLTTPSTGSGNLLQYEIMLHLKEMGVSSYNFVGCRINEDANSKYRGIQRFKERFGGTLQEGYLFSCTLRPLYRWCWERMLKLLGKKSTNVITEEIHKWQSIN